MFFLTIFLDRKFSIEILLEHSEFARISIKKFKFMWHTQVLDRKRKPQKKLAYLKELSKFQITKSLTLSVFFEQKILYTIFVVVGRLWFIVRFLKESTLSLLPCMSHTVVTYHKHISVSKTFVPFFIWQFHYEFICY